MKFLTNIYDPKQPDAKRFMAIRYNENRDDAWENHLSWLKGKIIGEPQPTNVYTVQQLKDENMVGVYTEEK